MWKKIAGFILRYRLLLIILLAIFTAFMLYKGKDIKMSYEYTNLLPETDSTYINYIKFKKTFGEDANIFVLGFEDSTFFSLKKFTDLQKLTKTLKSIDGVKDVVSVAQVISLVKDAETKSFKYKKIFPDKISSQHELDSLKKEVLKIPLYNGIFYNDTSHTFLIGVSIEKRVLNDKARIELVDKIKQQANKFGVAHNVKIRFSGLPYIRTEITGKVKKELNIFLILAALISIIILYIFFRSVKAVFFAMIVVAVAVLWVMGTMGIFHYKITILTGMIPPLLIVIGIPNSIFLINKYFAEYKRHGNKIKALQRVIMKTGSAIFLTNLTTAAGFATFIITDSKILSEFGIVASLNILALFVLSLIIIPISYSYASPPKIKHTKHLDGKFTSKIIRFLVKTTKYRRKYVYALVILFVLIGIYGVSLIKTTGYMVDDLPKDDEVYTDLKFFESHFKGVMPIEIVIDTKKRNGAYKLSTLKKVDKLQKKLHKYPELSKSLSIVDGIKLAKQAFYNGNPKKYKLPKKQESAFIFTYLKNSKSNGNTNFINSFVDDSLHQLIRISSNVEDIGTTKMAKLYKDVNADIDSIFKPKKYKSFVTGTSVMFFKGTKYLVNNLYVSLSLAILLISLFMSLMFNSWRMVIISLIPNLLPLLLTAGMMGYFGVPIKPSTILVFSIAFGISVDDTIHYLAKYRQELIANNWNIKLSVLNALEETGISMLFTSIVLFFGFGIFTTSSFGGTQALGLLISFTLLIAMLSNLILLPSLLLSFERIITTKAFKEPLLSIFDEEEDIELDDLEIKPNKTNNNLENN